MGTVAVVFPGQGSQRPGMARDFHERFAASRKVFSEASDVLGIDFAALCFGDDARLDLTEFTQPAILTAEIAMLRPLCDELGLRPALFGGHSLGEYTALCAAGAMPLDVALKLVRRRGALMQAAVPAGEGAMVAVCGPGVAALELRRPLDEFAVDIANVNSPEQVVLSGPAAAMELACARTQQLAGDTALEMIPLAVSAPFHSRRMRAIEKAFRAALEDVAPRLLPAQSSVVTSNLRGGFHTGTLVDLLDALEGQISGPVNWMANMRELLSSADRIFEIGPARPLRGFFKSIGVEIASITSFKTAEKAIAA